MIPSNFRALGRRPKADAKPALNKTEREWADGLDARIKVGEILWYGFEAIKIRLADNTFYTPDFLVLLADHSLEVHEVKGAFVMDDARIKFKVCAEHFPARLVWAQKIRGGAWKVEVMG